MGLDYRNDLNLINEQVKKYTELHENMINKEQSHIITQKYKSDLLLLNNKLLLKKLKIVTTQKIY